MKKFLSRRNVLRGTGVCLALPWLESLAPKAVRAQAATAPKRFLPIYFPNGAAAEWWFNAPAFGTSVMGDQFILSPVHEPMAAIKNKLLIVSRIANYSWIPGGATGINPSHSREPAALMTITDVDALAMANGMDPPSAVINNVSADQIMVQKANLGSLTPLASMQVGLGSRPGAFDGRSYAYNQVMSWPSQTEPLKRQINPKAVFDAMVQAGAMTSTGAPDPAAEAAAQQRAAENKSVLDAVLANATSLQNKIGAHDKAVIDEFMTSFRAIEQQVTQVGSVISAGCQVIAEPGAVPEPGGAMQGLNQGDEGYDRQAHAAVMNDLVAMAFQCDVTRVITYMLDDSRSEFNYTFIPDEDKVFGDTGGIDNFHGGAQHGPGGIDTTAVNGVYPGESNAAFATITRWFARKVGELALKLDAMPEGDGTVLDNTLMVMTSGMRTHDHDCFDLPVLMLGGTGFIKQNGHIALAANPSDRQMRDLWFTIMNEYYNIGETSFGESTSGEPNSVIPDFLA